MISHDCECDLRHRQWNGAGKCLTCGCKYLAFADVGGLAAMPTPVKTPIEKLTIKWSKRENALVYAGSKPTGGMLAGVFERIKLGEMNERMCSKECNRNGVLARLRDSQPPNESDSRTLAQELESRGYDLTTLKFTIQKKQPPHES